MQDQDVSAVHCPHNEGKKSNTACRFQRAAQQRRRLYATWDALACERKPEHVELPQGQLCDPTLDNPCRCHELKGMQFYFGEEGLDRIGCFATYSPAEKSTIQLLKCPISSSSSWGMKHHAVARLIPSDLSKQPAVGSDNVASLDVLSTAPVM